MGYLRLSKTLRANRYAEMVKENGSAIIQVMWKDIDYFQIWKKAAEHNGAVLTESDGPMNKPWDYHTFTWGDSSQG